MSHSRTTSTPTATPAPVPVVYSDAYFIKMRAFVMTPERLKYEGYKLGNLGKDEILGFRRCRDCHGLFSFLDWVSGGEWS